LLLQADFYSFPIGVSFSAGRHISILFLPYFNNKTTMCGGLLAVIAGLTRNLNPPHIVSLSWIRRLRVKPAMTAQQ
jgi:hypothetical protein